MKATGIIRRVDELGRIVIPKEIRKSFKIRESEALEIFVEENDRIVLKKYEPLYNLRGLASSYIEALKKNTNFDIVICDTKRIIATSGLKEYLYKDINEEVVKIIKNRAVWNTKETSPIQLITKDEETYYSQAIIPIIADMEPVGAIIIFSKEIHNIVSQMDIKYVQLAADIISRNLE